MKIFHAQTVRKNQILKIEKGEKTMKNLEIISAIFAWAAATDIEKALIISHENGFCKIESDENDMQITFDNKYHYKRFIHEIVDACLYDGIEINIYKTYATICTDANSIEIQVK